jgi:hypothetical protein
MRLPSVAAHAERFSADADCGNGHALIFNGEGIAQRHTGYQRKA